jgi:hypothetical protein
MSLTVNARPDTSLPPLQTPDNQKSTKTGSASELASTPATTAADAAGDKNVLKNVTPQAYAVAASYVVGTKVGPFEVGTKILIAGLGNAEAANKGDLLEAVKKGTAFISITLPGAKTPIVGTFNPSTQSLEWGKGIAPKFFFGGNALFFANARSGGRGGSDPAVTGSVNAGVLFKIPGSEAISGALSKLITGASRLGEGAQLAASLGSALPGVVAEEALRKVLSDTVASGKFWVGPAYRASMENNGRVTLKGLNGSVDPEQLVKDGLSKFAFDANNFGQTEIAYGKNRWLVDRGTSYFQLSPVSGGRNHGDPALEIINRVNAAGRQAGLLPSRLGEASDTNARSTSYVKLWQSVASGTQAEQLLTKLKTTLPADRWQALVAELRPAAQRLGMNFGQAELAGGKGPQTDEDRASRAALLRDYNKNSHPQEYREVVTVKFPPGNVIQP